MNRHFKPNITPGPWRQGRLLLTADTKRWSKEEQERTNYAESLRILSKFRTEDQGRASELLFVASDIDEHTQDNIRAVTAVPEMLGVVEAARSVLWRANQIANESGSRSLRYTQRLQKIPLIGKYLVQLRYWCTGRIEILDADFTLSGKETSLMEALQNLDRLHGSSREVQ